MCSTKRVQLVVLFLIAGALSAGTPPLAAGATSAKLKPVPSSDEPDASGQAKLGNLTLVFWNVFTGDLSVTCRGLQPGARYAVVTDWSDGSVRSFTASARGTGDARGLVSVYQYPTPPPFPPSFRQVNVAGFRDDGTDPGILVLRGYLYP